MANKIQIKRGLKANLPILDAGEPAFTTDTKEFFIGDGSNNIEFAKQSDLEITNTQLSDLTFQTAGGTATAIILSTQTLVNGYSKTFIASTSNGGVATTINGKPLYKPNSTIAPNLISGKAYTVWYNAAGDCFFIKASAEGTAVAGNVLAGATFSNDNDTGIQGGMANNGAVNQSLSINGTYTIPAGYHNGTGKVSQTITTKAATTYNPSTTAQTIAAGQYLSGAQTISAVTGNANKPQVLSGYTFASANGIGLTGTMPYITGDANSHYNATQITAGVYSGDGSNYAYMGVPNGNYLNNVSWIQSYQPYLLAQYIVSGAQIFGVAGSATPSSMGGRYYASGAFTAPTSG